MNSRSVLTLIIPCFNEAENIPGVFPEIVDYCEKHNFQIIAIDDGSKDATLAELRKLQSERLNILCHSVNRGYGAAIKTGIRHCTTERCITIDADGQHDLLEINKLLAVMAEENADLVIGNRQGRGSSYFRNMGKFIIFRFTKAFFKLPITDLNSGMKLYNTDIAKSLIHWTPNGMAYSDVVTLIHYQLRYKVTECDINIKQRMLGKSTISWKTAVYTLSEIAFLVVNVFPFRFFSIISLFFFAFGIAWGTPFALRGVGITVGSALLITIALITFLQGMMMELLVRLKYQNYVYPKAANEVVNEGEA